MFAAGEVWLIKGFNKMDIDLPIFCAIMLNGYWPLQLIVYIVLRSRSGKKRELSRRKILSYAVIGCNAAVICLFRSFGINYLSGSLYVIAASSEIIFTTIFSRISGKNVTYSQYFSVFMVCCALVLALYDPDTKSFGNSPEETSQSKLIYGFVFAVSSRALSALNSVGAEKLLGKSRKTLLGVHEVSFANSFIPSLVLPCILKVDGEYTRWKTKFADGNDHMRLLGIVAICIGLTNTKFLDRVCKFTIVSRKSSVFFGVVDAAMKSAAGIGSYLMFDEDTDWTDFAAFGLVLLSFIPMITKGFRRSKTQDLSTEPTNAVENDTKDDPLLQQDYAVLPPDEDSSAE